MTPKEFDKILKSRIEKTKTILSIKAGEYANDLDRFHNFNVAARINKQTKEQALWGMSTKHLVSIIDMIEGTVLDTPLSLDQINEKLGDMINYLHLLEAMLIERTLKQTPLV